MTLRYRDIDKHLAGEADTVTLHANGGVDDSWRTTLPFYLAWLTIGVGALLAMNHIVLRFPRPAVRGEVSAAFAGAWLSVSVVGVLWLMQRKPIRLSALRSLADLPAKVTPLEAEYCRTIAALIEQKQLTESATRDVVAALNTLLQKGRLVDELLKEMQTLRAVSNAPSLSEEATQLDTLLQHEDDPTYRTTLTALLDLNQTRQGNDATLARNKEHLRLRREVIVQTFLTLRGTLQRGQLVHQGLVPEDLLPEEVIQKEMVVPDLREVVANLQRQVQKVEAATEELLAARAG